MKYFLSFLTIAAISFILYIFFIDYKKDESKRATIEQSFQQEDLNIYNIQSIIYTLNFNNQNEIESTLKLKAAIIAFNQGEDFIKQSILLKSILESYTESNKDYGQSTGGTLSRFYEMQGKAYDKFTESKNYLDSVNYDGDQNFKYTLNYLKGCVNYRILFFVGTDGMEYWNHSFSAFKECLKYKPNDPHSILNIELLIKKQKSMNKNGKDESSGVSPSDLKSPNFGVKNPKGKY